MSDEKAGVGIIGLGGFGRFLLREWSKLDEVQVVAGSDAYLTGVPDGRDDVTFYADYKDLLDDPRVEIVGISTPPSTHALMALAAIEKGKHVIVEKPLALTAAEGHEIAEAARKAGVVATVDFMLRYNPIVEALKKIVAAHVFGRPRRIDLRNYATQDTVPPGHWFWNQEISGGIMIEHGVHFFDMSSWVLGAAAVEATGFSSWRNEQQEDRVFAAVKFEDDVIGTYWHSFTRPLALETTSFHMAFDLGEIEILGWIPLSISLWGWTDQKGTTALKEHVPNLALVVDESEPFDTSSSGLVFRVSQSVRGSAQIDQPKVQVYSDLVRATLLDVLAAIHDPGHKLRVTLDDAIAAVAVAEQATLAQHNAPMRVVPRFSEY